MIFSARNGSIMHFGSEIMMSVRRKYWGENLFRSSTKRVCDERARRRTVVPTALAFPAYVPCRARQLEEYDDDHEGVNEDGSVAFQKQGRRRPIHWKPINFVKSRTPARETETETKILTFTPYFFRVVIIGVYRQSIIQLEESSPSSFLQRTTQGFE